MQTDYNAPWRSKRFKSDPTDTPAKQAIKANYKWLADNASVDVAVRYLATTVANKASGPINVTGLFTKLFGQGTGQAILNSYYDNSPGASAQMNSIGLGDDFVIPYVRVRSDGVSVEVGNPVSAKYKLPVADVTRMRVR